MPRFSIGILFERADPTHVRKSIRHGVVVAPSKEAALGSFILKCQEDYELKNFAIVLTGIFELEPFIDEGKTE